MTMHHGDTEEDVVEESNYVVIHHWSDSEDQAEPGGQEMWTKKGR